MIKKYLSSLLQEKKENHNPLSLGGRVGKGDNGWRNKQSHTPFETVDTLLSSKYHEERLAGVLILVEFAKRKTFPLETIAKFYMAHTDRINNWDLVDTSAGYIIGPYLAHCLSESDRTDFIEKCITSEHLWTNRIVILASLYFIMQGDASMIFSIAPRFFPHRHDLIHKATGWMLREAGKRVSEKLLCDFLDMHAGVMPRTMLQYGIERLSEEKKRKYMQAPRNS